MDFNPSDLQRMLIDSAERLITERFTLEHRRALRASPDGMDGDAWRTFAELGWLAILVPEEAGGLGGSMTDAAVLATVLGSRCVTEPFTSTAVMGATLLAGAATPQGELLEALVTGEARFALAHDEPGDRYAYGVPRATRLTTSGNGYVLSGQKMLALDAPSATHAIVTANSPAGPALVIVPLEAPGIEKAAYALYDGSRAADLRFDNAPVESGQIVAEGTDAEALLAFALDRTRIALAAQAVGSMEAELDICAAYLKERQQFGQPIGRFQSLQHIMADMFVAAHQARSILYFALSKLDADPAQRARAVALARLQIGEAGQLVSRQAVQLHGGYGVTDEYEVSHHYRRQLVIEKQYGDVAFAVRNASFRQVNAHV